MNFGIRMTRPTVVRSSTPLTDNQIAAYAPSVFADAPHDSRAESYAFIKTSDVLNGLRQQGFQPFEARQTRVRDQSKREHTKHLLRLRHPDAIANKEGFGEIILLNSHDGSSSFQLMSGFFRMVCSNGLIAGSVTSDHRVRHTGRVINDVVDAAWRVVDEMQTVEGCIDEWKSIALSDAEQEVFARSALTLKYEEDKAPVSARALMVPRRYEDRPSSLWNTFNRVQEHMTQGGLRGRSANGRRMTTRAVNGVDQTVGINKALWTLADQMAKIKSAN